MASEALKKFADELKFTRESKAITLQQIAGKTKIDLKFLQAIEDANYDILPEIYVRAFIKEYSQTCDLNSKVILQKFDNAKAGKQEEKLPEVVHTKDNSQKEPVEENILTTDSIQTTQLSKTYNSDEGLSTQPDIPKEKTIKSVQANYVIGGLIAVAALVIIYFSFFSSSSSEIIQVTTDSNVGNTKNERFELAKKSAESNQSEIQSPINTTPLSTDSLRLLVLTTEKVWVKVSTDGKILQQSVVQANSKMNFSAKKSFSVSIGNAGRVKVYFNNKPVENVGKPGEIRNLFITSDGIKYYTIPPQKNEEKSPTTN